MLIGKRAAVVNVKPHYKDLISNPVQLCALKMWPAFQRLELEIDTKPLVIGESRAYKLWGYPQGGALSRMLRALWPVVSPVATTGHYPESGVVTHNAPRIVAEGAGSVDLVATVGAGDKAIKSQNVRLDVVDANSDDATLTADPQFQCGWASPLLPFAFARRPGESSPRHIDAVFESQSPEILRRARAASSSEKRWAKRSSWPRWASKL